MEEARVIALAIRYFEDLRQGTDPVGRQPAPEGDLLGREDLNGMFALAARLLQEELDQVQGQPLPPPRREEEPRRLIVRLCALDLGLDPFQGGFLPAGSVLGQEQVHKCLLWTQKFLRRRLEREVDEAAQSAPSGVVYALPPEEVRRRVNCTQEPVLLNLFLGPVGVLLGFTGDKTAFARRGREWMIQERLLDLVPSGVQATPAGEALGLESQERTAKDGSRYQVVACSPAAQQFLLDHLEDILAFNAARWEPVLACLTPEFTAGLPCLREPASLTKFLNHINALLPPDLPAKLVPSEVSLWLQKQGLLEDRFAVGHKHRMPTEAGASVGLVPRSFGNIEKIWEFVYAPEGQRFILDHLRDIVRDVQSGKAFQTIPVELEIPEAVRGAPLSGNPSLTHRGVADWLNGLLESALGVRLPDGLISEWLAAEGLLERVARPGGGRNVGKTMLVPTERGRAAGLALDSGADYRLTVYLAGAQRYVRDHVKEIIAFWRDW